MFLVEQVEAGTQKDEMEQRQTTRFFRFMCPPAGIMQVGKRGLPTQYSFPLETGHPFQAAEQSMATAQ